MLSKFDKIRFIDRQMFHNESVHSKLSIDIQNIHICFFIIFCPFQLLDIAVLF